MLIVEDEPAIARLLVRLVRARGARALVASSRAEALAVLADACPRLAIVDLVIPGGGVTLIDTMRATLGAAMPAVVLISGRPDALDHADHADVRAILLKPFSLREIEALISRYTSPRALHEESAPPTVTARGA